MSVPVSSPAKLNDDIGRIVRDAYTAYARHYAGVMPANRCDDILDDLSWALTMAEFSSKVQGETEHKARHRRLVLKVSW